MQLTSLTIEAILSLLLTPLHGRRRCKFISIRQHHAGLIVAAGGNAQIILRHEYKSILRALPCVNRR